MKKIKKIISVAIVGALIINTGTALVFAESSEKSVYVGGQSFGLKMFTNGVMVVELESYYNGNGYVCPAKEGGLEVSDIIEQANGQKVNTNEDLQALTTNCDGEPITFNITRNGNEIKKTVTPQKNMAGMYLMGAWVRDSCAGIGTVTYYDSEKSYFAALGHGICDSDTKQLMPLGSGEAVKTSISGINKSSCGNAGSLCGYFTDNVIGNLTKNTDIGVYGTINDNIEVNTKKLKVAECSEIRPGKAEMLTTINGEETQSYDIEIIKICNKSSTSNENFVIKVTNNELLQNCGGIVQGMSGSPIIQNEKLVGAVTHVFVNTPELGYGIIAQNMVLNYEN